MEPFFEFILNPTPRKASNSKLGLIKSIFSGEGESGIASSAFKINESPKFVKPEN